MGRLELEGNKKRGTERTGQRHFPANVQVKDGDDKLSGDGLADMPSSGRHQRTCNMRQLLRDQQSTADSYIPIGGEKEHLAIH
jgi:lipopolysaccharide export system protein LptA